MQKEQDLEIDTSLEKGYVQRPAAYKKIYTGDELMAMNIKELPKFWEPALPAHGLGLFVGSSDCGKSTILRQLAIACCRNDATFLNNRLHCKHNRVLVVSTEDDVHGVAFCLNRQIDTTDQGEWRKRIAFLFEHEDVLRKIDARLEEAPCDLVIIDSWGDIFHGNPNSFPEVRKSLNELKEIAIKHNCLFLLLHHTVKHSEKFRPDKNRLNGSQAIEAKARIVLELRKAKEPNERILTILKCNFLADEAKQKSLILSFDKDKFLFKYSGRALDLEKEYGSKSKYLNKDILVAEAQEIRKSQNCSFREIREELIKRYGEDVVPGLTWFKNNLN